MQTIVENSQKTISEISFYGTSEMKQRTAETSSHAISPHITLDGAEICFSKQTHLHFGHN